MMTTGGNYQQIRARNLRVCFAIAGCMGIGMMLWGFLYVPFEPYAKADQIFTSIGRLSADGHTTKQTHDQIVTALRAGERSRQIFVSGTGLLLLALSWYGYGQAKRMSEAEPSDEPNGASPRRLS